MLVMIYGMRASDCTSDECCPDAGKWRGGAWPSELGGQARAAAKNKQNYSPQVTLQQFTPGVILQKKGRTL